MRALALLAAAALGLASSGTAFAETRVALVIGNGAYTHLSRLPNPRSDAELMAATLEKVGFAVAKVLDADQRTMKQAMLEFGRSLRASDAVGLFYYAGHGVQVSGENYLIPVNATIRDVSEVGLEGVNVNEFLATMERAAARINIVILDACRDNPFPGSSRSVTRGLARVEAPRGTYIAYATSPGAVALDGSTEHSPYTAALAGAIGTPGLTIEQVFKKTRGDVQRATGDAQTPWETSSITGEFYFQPGSGGRTGAIISSDRQPASAPTDNGQFELAFWNSVKDSEDQAQLRSYLDRFPAGAFAALARLKIEQLARRPMPPAVPVAPPPLPSVTTAPQPGPLIAWSSARLLDDAALSGLSCDQLWVARNEIYDRNGYCFQTARGRAYFDNADCRTNSQSILSAIEQRNVSTIQPGRSAAAVAEWP